MFDARLILTPSASPAMLWQMSLVLTLLAAPLAAQNSLDTVLIRGESPQSGTIKEIHAQFVLLEQRGRTERIELNKIDRIQWAKEPAELKNAREAFRRGDSTEARVQLEKLPALKQEKGGTGIQTEVQFLDAAIAAQSALAGSGEIEDARKKLFTFAKDNRESIHFYYAVEYLAEVEWARRDSASAVRFYEQWDKTPWPTFQSKALSRQARIQYAAQKPAEALVVWQDMASRAGLEPPQKTVAEAGVLLCQMATGQAPTDAITQIEQKIRDTNPDDESSLASLYLSLGYAHVLKQESTEALLAFLHVDTLFPQERNEHVEALAQLVPLWEQQGRQDRVRDTQMRLRTQYGGTYWGHQAKP